MKASTSARATVPLFAAQAIFAVLHRLFGTDYVRFTHAYNVAGELALACIWIAAAIAALVGRGGPAFIVVCLGATASFVHGLMVLTGTTASMGGVHWVGILFLLAGAVEAFLAVRAVPAFRHDHRIPPSWHARSHA
jgi:hypothetical protein